MSRHSTKKPEPKEHNFSERFKSMKWFPLLLVAVCVYVVVFLLMIVAVTPERHSVSANEIAAETITATKDVVDKITTDKLIEQARNNVTVQYQQDYNTTLQVNDNISAYFESLSTVYTSGQQLRATKLAATPKEKFNWLTSLSGDEITSLKQKCAVDLSNDELVAILNADESSIDAVRDAVSQLVTTSMQEGVKEQYVSDKVQELTQKIQENTGLDTDLKQIGVKAVSTYVKANLLIDQEATEKLRDEAEAQVTPVMYKKGQNIIVKGTLVTDAQIGVLDSLGLLSDKGVDVWLYIGIAIYLGIVFISVSVYLVLYMPMMIQNIKNIILLGTLTILVTAIATLAMRIDVRLVPVAFISMLLSTIFSSRLALFMNIMIVALVGGMLVVGGNGMATTSSLYAIVMYMTSGVAGAFATRRMQTRSKLMMAGVWVSLVNVGTAVAIGFMSISEFSSILINAAWGLANGVLCAVFCIGTLPIWESVFDVITPTKLLELANPNHPLIKKLMMEAPGTYHHSVMVANLGEAAAEAIGANPLLTRVGAFFHDVGKLRRPYYFSENQIDGENPHDKLPYSSSVQIISSHPKDGLQLAAKCRVPRQVQDIIAQHHGNSILMYFYLKAKNEADIQGKEIDANRFRYNGPKPQSREAALIMLADAVEAGVRAQSDKSPEAVRERVEKLIRVKIDDGQLDECNITFKEIHQIIEVFVKVFASMFHERLEYPPFDSKEENEARGR